MITLTFEDVKFQARFSAIIRDLKNPAAILMVSGRELANQLRAHFRDKDRTEANQLSDRRSHFWLQVARSVNQPQVESNTSVSVTISDPRFAQKLFGGTIRAKNAGALTIPEEERAYGRTAAVFEQETGLKLFVVKSGAGTFENALLAVKDGQGRGFTVEYVLTKSVTQAADTDALPQKAALEAAIISRAQRAADRQYADGDSNAENS